MIDQEIREIISSEYTRALDILKSKQDILEKGAQLLLEKEKIDGEEIKALMA
jgi:cell division protease FtsH